MAASIIVVGIYDATHPGFVPASGGGTTTFLRADGTWASVGGGSLSDGDKGDVTVSAAGATWTIDADVVTDAKLRNSVALSVIGRSANTVGDPADVVAASDGDVLRRSGATLDFGAILETSVTNLVADLAGKAATAHTHAEADVVGLVADLAAKQPLDATLTALAGLDATAGLVEETGADTFTKRALGVAAGTSVPTRADADARYAALAHTHPESDVTNLVADLDALAAGLLASDDALANSFMTMGA